MGAPNQDWEADRFSFKKELEQWSFPPSKWESRMVEEVSRLPVVTVTRPPAAALEKHGVRERKCHENARKIEYDSAGEFQKCVGWWILGGHYVLHSVVRFDGGYLCVTPAPLQPQDEYSFIPDSEIYEQVVNGGVDYFRKGQRIGAGLRSNPQETLRICAETRIRLEAGGDPYEAVQVLGAFTHRVVI